MLAPLGSFNSRHLGHCSFPGLSHLQHDTYQETTGKRPDKTQCCFPEASLLFSGVCRFVAELWSRSLALTSCGGLGGALNDSDD